MKVTVKGKTFNLDDAEIIAYSEESDLCYYPKGFRFQNVSLCFGEDEFFLHGVGYVGCHTILPITEKEKDWWLEQHKQENHE